MPKVTETWEGTGTEPGLLPPSLVLSPMLGPSGCWAPTGMGTMVFAGPAVPGSGWRGWDNRKPLYKMELSRGWTIGARGFGGASGFPLLYPLPSLTWACGRLAMKQRRCARVAGSPPPEPLGTKKDLSQNLKGEWVGGTYKQD